MYKINITDFGWSQIDDDFILYSISENSYYVLNETAKDIWEFIYNSSEPKSLEDIISYIKDTYEYNDNQDICIEIKGLLDKYLEIGTVMIVC